MLVPIPRDTTANAHATLIRMSQERWFGDFRSVGLVDWPEGMRDEFRLERQRLFLPMLLWPVLTVPALAVSIYLNAASFLNGWSPAAAAMSWVAVGVGIVVFAFGMMRCRKAWKRRGLIARVLRSDQLERFELSQSVIDEVLLAHARHHDTPEQVDPLAGVPLELLIAPRARLLVQIGDERDRPLTEVAIRSVSQHAGFEESADGYHIQLTPDELRELRAYRRKHMMIIPTTFLLGAIFVSVLALTVTTLNAAGPTSYRDKRLIAGTIVFAAAFVYAFFIEQPKQLRLARLLKRDIEDGFCEILDSVAAAEDLIAAGLPEEIRVDDTPSIVRRLPHSKRWWLIDETPAPWRRYAE